jgi:hypothetical protein
MIVERQSIIDAPAEQVWGRVVTPEGINDELRPWMTMSMPRGAESLTVDNVPIGTPVGRCWMRLFGVLPFDYDHLTIAELWPGQGFHEESTMMSMRLWRHDAASRLRVTGKPLCATALPLNCARPFGRLHLSSRPGYASCSDTGTDACNGISPADRHWKANWPTAVATRSQPARAI